MSNPAASTARRCVFCGASEPTREHVLRKKFQRTLDRTAPENLSFTHDRTTAFGNISSSKRAYRGIPFELTVKAACAECNNGWMNDLENAVETDLLDMIAGRHLSLNADRARNLARWVLKTALMRQLINGQVADWTTPRFREIYEDDLSGPVWVAGTMTPEASYWPQMPTTLVYITDARGEYRVLFCTILIRHMTLHSITALDRSGPRKDFGQLHVMHSEAMHGDWLNRIWPNPGHVRWKNRLQFSSGDDSLRMTAHLLGAVGLIDPKRLPRIT